jgi:phosphatidate cytidylyltransferase
VAAIVLAIVSSQRETEARISGGFGVIYVFAMVFGLYVLREGPWDGRLAALYFMSFVWASDAAAYFFGRLIRGPRLLPKESPNKTWSGAISAVIACAVCGYLAAGWQDAALLPWVLTGMCISVGAQAGDLFESGLKRRFKVKDSGNILPGHGGLLDRVDGLGAVSILATLTFLSVPGLPALLGL